MSEALGLPSWEGTVLKGSEQGVCTSNACWRRKKKVADDESYQSKIISRITKTDIYSREPFLRETFPHSSGNICAQVPLGTHRDEPQRGAARHLSGTFTWHMEHSANRCKHRMCLRGAGGKAGVEEGCLSAQSFPVSY